MDTLRNEILSCTDGLVCSHKDGREYELTYRFGEDFTVFSGHFPGHPILPGFVQLLIGECALRIRSQRHLILRCVKRAKFLKPIRPDQGITVCWRERSLDDGLEGSFTLLADGAKAATFTIEMVLEEGRDA